MEDMFKTTRVVIIRKDNTPLMFTDNVVIVYPTITDAQRDFWDEYDKEIISLKDYMKSDLYKTYNKLSFEM